MNNVVLYIGDDVVDLVKSTSVSQSFQAFNIGDLETRNANYTNKLVGAFTENNSNIFQMAHVLQSGSSKPYQKLYGKIVTDGIETMTQAVILLTDVDSSGYQLEVYSGVYDFFDIIGTKNIRELDLHEYDTGSLDPQIITPYINSGNRTKTQDPDLSDWTDPDGIYWPLYAFPYSKVIDQIIIDAGYEKSGNIFSNAKYAAMHFGFLGYGGYNQEFKKPKEFEAAADGTQSVVSGASYTKVEFPTLISGNDAGYWDNLNTYTAGDPQGGLFGGTWYTFNGFAVLNVTIVGAGNVEFTLFSPLTGAFPTTPFTFGAGTHDMVFEISAQTIGAISGIDGSEMYVRLRAASGTPTVTINTGTIRVEVNSEKAGTYLGAAGILPDMMQRDVMRDFLVRFGLIPIETGNTLVFKTIEEIITDKANFVDWTEKESADIFPTIKFTLDRYAQRNTFKYEILEDDIDERLGEGYIDVSNDSLEEERINYTSPFNASETLKLGNDTDGYVWCCYVPIYKRNGTALEEDLGDPGARLILVRDAYAYETNANDKGYFNDVNAPYSLGFQSFLDEHYASLIESLQKAKTKNAFFYLHNVDAAQLQFNKLVYVSGNWYLLNKVSNFIPGQLTRVELFKVV